jgi:hypothetical protein
VTSEITEPEAISLQEFLQAVPPREAREVSGLAEPHGSGLALTRPDITLFCSDRDCGRLQNFESISEWIRLGVEEQTLIIRYRCKNCERFIKTFALLLLDRDGEDGHLVKLGELPDFGPPLPARLQRLVQSERDFLLKAFQSENKGFGIGAFAYYRRLVEDLKNHLIDEIVKTCRKIPKAESFISILEEARGETQFSKAIKKIGDAIPDGLRIDGHNPLTLLHQALSRDLHSASDEDCLEAATAIRIVLIELSERMAQITRENSELKTALSNLFGKGTGA